MPWSVGQTLKDGYYEIVRTIGQGGFGITYLAKDKRGQYVVLKTLNDEKRYDLNFNKYEQDFLNEARRLAKCSNSKNPHPNIVQIYELFPEGSVWCMVMEYINEQSLYNRVKHQGVLPESEALRYIHQIGEALIAIHKQGLIHRDVKPLNIMLRSTKGNFYDAVLIDFGIAREFIPDLTQTHTQFVSSGFAPIEQYQQKARRDAYTDIYALAATLYFMLTGETPVSAQSRFDGAALKSPRTINQYISAKAERAILKGMAFNPYERPKSVQAWLGMLDDTNEGLRQEWSKLSKKTLDLVRTGFTFFTLKKSEKKNILKKPTNTILSSVFVAYFISGCILHVLSFGALLEIQPNNDIRFILFAADSTMLVLIFFLTEAEDSKNIMFTITGLFILISVNSLLPWIEIDYVSSLSRKGIENLIVINIISYLIFILFQYHLPVFRLPKQVFIYSLLFYYLFLFSGWIFSEATIELLTKIF